MRRLGIEETLPVQLNLKECVTEAIESLALRTSSGDIEIHYVFVAHDESFTHVNFSWGVENASLVIVIDSRHEATRGHRILDPNNLYGLS